MLELLEDRTLPSVAFTVNNTSNDPAQSGSLPYAVLQANADSSGSAVAINFDATVFATPETITLNGTLDLNNALAGESITINGPSAGLTLAGGGSGSDFSVITVEAGNTATCNSLTITRGVSSSAGGGITNAGTLTLNNCTLTGNAGNSGGAILNSGTLTLNNCTVTGNGSSVSIGGGIDNQGSSLGQGGILNVYHSTLSSNTGGATGGGIESGTNATLTVVDCTLSGNAAAQGGAIDIGIGGSATLMDDILSGNTAPGTDAFSGNGGGISNAGNLTLNDSTLAGNTAVNGGGIYNVGWLTLSNATLFGNSAQSSTALSVEGGGIDNQGFATVSDSTITGNSTGNPNSAAGGGIWSFASSLTVQNTIVAGNTAVQGPDVEIFQGGAPTTTPGSYNLIGIGTDSGFFNHANGNQVGTAASPINPQFDPKGLQNNGGLTPTVALEPGSPALGTGGPTTTLAAALGVTDTSLTVADATTITRTAPTQGTDYLLEIDQEQILVIGVSSIGSAFTVIRGVNGTIPAAHSLRAGVLIRPPTSRGLTLAGGVLDVEARFQTHHRRPGPGVHQRLQCCLHGEHTGQHHGHGQRLPGCRFSDEDSSDILPAGVAFNPA